MRAGVSIGQLPTSPGRVPYTGKIIELALGSGAAPKWGSLITLVELIAVDGKIVVGADLMTFKIDDS